MKLMSKIRQKWKTLIITASTLYIALMMLKKSTVPPQEIQQPKVAVKSNVTEDPIYKLRASKIRNICKQLKEKPSIFQVGPVNKMITGIDKSHFIKEPETGSLLCLNYKVGITSWLKMFYAVNQNKPRLDKILGNGLLYRLIPAFGLKAPQILAASTNPNIFKFIAVRNPLDRLLSAFTNRIRSKSVTYKAHVSRVTNHGENGRKYKNGEEVSFEDFLLYVIGGSLDVHWLSYWRSCSPCVVHYDAVMKLEDGADGIEYILQASGMNKYAQMPPPQNTSKKSPELYREISCATLEKVYKFFKLDFILFGFSAKEYLEEAGVSCSFSEFPVNTKRSLRV